MALQFITVELYGGAITVEMPTGFLDASTIRDIPSHQEVFLQNEPTPGSTVPANTPPTSIITDLLERASPPAHPTVMTDEQAIEYHYKDITGVGQTRAEMAGEAASETSTMFWTDKNFQALGIQDMPPGGSAPDFLVCVGVQHSLDTVSAAAPVVNGATQEPTSPPIRETVIILALIRLLPNDPDRATDFLIAINIPRGHGQRPIDTLGGWGDSVQTELSWMNHMLRTVCVRDWDLFGGA